MNSQRRALLCASSLAAALPFASGKVPVFRVDARQHHDASALMMALAAMLEMNERLPQPVSGAA